MAESTEPRPTFESRLAELERLVRELEGGRLGLEDSIATFEKGKALHRDLLSELAGYERRIEVLVRNDDGTDRPVDGSRLDPAAGGPSA